MNHVPHTSFLFLRQQEPWPPVGPSVGRKSEWLPVFVGRALGRALLTFLTFLGGRDGASDLVCAGPRPPLRSWVFAGGVGAAGRGMPPLAGGCAGAKAAEDSLAGGKEWQLRLGASQLGRPWSLGGKTRVIYT
uniref:Uncharacterized protein n=1 Tax=Pipistrellus kuhlii TaxID=59472 RepID=A0A7J7UGD4_PIPKU|nr:hypothetical protein mPipKuh1_009062 [Pipistrellus kuhlii]